MAKQPKRGEYGDIEDYIISIADADPYLKLLVYGKNGKGKTRLAASAPKVLIIDVNEKGTKSARSFVGAKVLPISTWADIGRAYWFLRKGKHPFESVAIDTLTAMQNLCMSHVLGEEAERDPNKDAAMPRRQDWGKLAELMKHQLLNYRNLPMHVIFTAQERQVGDLDEGEPIMHVPELTPGSRGTAMGSVDIIGRIYKKELIVKQGKKKVKKWETCLLVGDHDEFETKDRTGSLGRIVRAPSIPKMIEAFDNSLDEEEEED